MAQILYTCTPLAPRDTARFFEFDGPLIDFLVREFPKGFDRPYKVMLGPGDWTNVPVDDFDVVLNSSDQVIITEYPADPVSAAIAGATGMSLFLANTIVNFAFSLATTLILNLLFPPPGPPDGPPEADPVYDIRFRQNSARLGSPIPVHYGDVVVTPDLAAPSYHRYWNNDDYFYALMVLGHGTYDLVSEPGKGAGIWIGDSAVGKDIPDESIEYVLLHPDPSEGIDGGFPWGRVQSLVNATLSPPVLPNPDTINAGLKRTEFWEECFTAENSERVELTQPKNSIPVQTGGWVSGETYDNGDTTIYVKECWFPNPESPLDPATAIGTRAAVRAANPDMGDDAIGLIKGWFVVTPGDPYALNINGDRVDPMQGVTGRIEVDMILPNGLIENQDDGGTDDVDAFFVIEYQRWEGPDVNVGGRNEGWGDSRFVHVRFNARTSTPQRITVGFNTIPFGFYRTRLVNVYNKKRSYANSMVIGAVRSRIYRNSPEDKTQRVYGNCTLLAIRAKAGETFASQSATRIRCRIRRRLYQLGNRETWLGPRREVQHLIADMLTDPTTGGGRPVAEMDERAFRQLRDPNTHPTKDFNGSFTRAGSLLEAMQTVLTLYGGRIVPTGAQVSAVRDGPRTSRTAMFSPDNIVSGTLTTNYQLGTVSGADNDGVKVVYNEYFDWEEKDIVHPGFGEFQSIRPKDYRLIGCTNRNFAEAYAKLLHRRTRLERTLVEFSTGLEGLLLELGDRIVIGWPDLSWGTAARCVGTGNNRILLDRPVAGDQMFMRAIGGQVGYVSKVTVSSDGMSVSYKGDLPVAGPFTDTEDYGPTLFLFTTTGEGSVKDFIVTEVTPESGGTVKVKAIVYDEAVFEGTIFDETFDWTIP